METIKSKSLDEVRYRPPGAEETLSVRLSLKRSELPKLEAFMAGDTWEQAQAARDAQHRECTKSITIVLDTARRHQGTTGGRVCATLLASLYNGQRVRMDVSDLKSLDQDLFEHAMNTIRLCVETNSEPHQWFNHGGEILERLIADWGLEKKRRVRA